MIYRGKIALNREELIERACFVSAVSHNEATMKIYDGASMIYDISPFEISVKEISSEDELKSKGLSYSREWRLFEEEWSNGRCQKWSTSPLFLTPNPRLQHVWASLPIAGSGGLFTDDLFTGESQPVERAWMDIMLSKLDDLTFAAENDDDSCVIKLKHEIGALRELAQKGMLASSSDGQDIIQKASDQLND